VVWLYLRTIKHRGQGVDGYAADRHEQYCGSWCVDMAHAAKVRTVHGDSRFMTPNHHDKQ
jgi:allantoicase